MKNLLAAAEGIKIAPNDGFTGLGESSAFKASSNPIVSFSNIISMGVGLMTIIAIIWTVFTIIIGAIGIISSGGDKQALESARKKITTGVIGLIVVILSLVLVNLIGRLLGVPNILNLGVLFANLNF